jgi:hypothetical protein
VATEGPRKTLRKAIVSDIDRGSLRQILAEATPSRDFDALVTADTDYDKQVSQLIRRANNEGWIGDLVNAVLEARKRTASCRQTKLPRAVFQRPRQGSGLFCPF